MPRLTAFTVALRTLRGEQLPMRCRISRERAVEMLRRMTGQDFGDDATAWAEWLRHNPGRASGVEAAGVVTSLEKNKLCRVRLDDGPEVLATIPKAVVRRAFLIRPGDRVRLRLEEPGLSRVTAVDRQPGA